MAHQVAELFDIADRGYVRVGQAADLVLVSPDSPWVVDRAGLRYKCGWSPFEGRTFRSAVQRTWVNGNTVYDGENVYLGAARRLTFNR
jgi:dihydroorotase